MAGGGLGRFSRGNKPNRNGLSQSSVDTTTTTPAAAPAPAVEATDAPADGANLNVNDTSNEHDAFSSFDNDRPSTSGSNGFGSLDNFNFGAFEGNNDGSGDTNNNGEFETGGDYGMNYPDTNYFNHGAAMGDFGFNAIGGNEAPPVDFGLDPIDGGNETPAAPASAPKGVNLFSKRPDKNPAPEAIQQKQVDSVENGALPPEKGGIEPPNQAMNLDGHATNFDAASPPEEVNALDNKVPEAFQGVSGTMENADGVVNEVETAGNPFNGGNDVALEGAGNAFDNANDLARPGGNITNVGETFETVKENTYPNEFDAPEPKVPESISNEGQVDVQDDLTENDELTVNGDVADQGTNGVANVTTNGIAGDEGKSPIEEANGVKQAAPRNSLSPSNANRNSVLSTRINSNGGTSPRITTTTNQSGTNQPGNQAKISPKISPPKQQFKNTASRVSLSPPPTMQVANRNVGESNSVLNDNGDGNLMKDPVINTTTNQYAPNDVDVSADDDNSIVIPGMAPFAMNDANIPLAPEVVAANVNTIDAENMATLGMGMKGGIGDALETSMDLNVGEDVVDGEKAAVTPTQPIVANASMQSQFNAANLGASGSGKPSLVNRSASRFNSRVASGTANTKARSFSFAQASKQAKEAGKTAQKNVGTKNAAATATATSTTVTPPGRGRARSNAITTPLTTRPNANNAIDNAVTPEVVMQNQKQPALGGGENGDAHTGVPPSMTAPTREIQKQPSIDIPARPLNREIQKQPAVQGQNNARVPRPSMQSDGMQKQPVAEGHRTTTLGGNALTSPDDTIQKQHVLPTTSPPPHELNTNSITPKTSNVQLAPTANQPVTATKDSMWNLSIDPSISTLTFDELLTQFLEDIQEAADLHDQNGNDLLDLEVELSHAMSLALRYKADMMDLLDEVERATAENERLIAQYSE